MIEKKIFGRTGHQSRRTIFGSAAFWAVSQDTADKTLELLLEYDINHIDTAASYGDAELRIGPWMREHRKHFFLATKTMERTQAAAMEELYKSLDRLKTDYVDLWQIHAITNRDEWEAALSPGGAIDAFLDAKEKGLTRYLGITGHGVEVAKLHQLSIENYEFDAVLLPYNYAMMLNPEYAEAFNKLAKICKKKNVALQTIKSIARSYGEHQPSGYNMWYDPIDDNEALDHAVSWVLGNEQVFLNTAGDVTLLPKILKSAANFQKRPDDYTMNGDMKKHNIKPLFTHEFSGP
ncbi:MAG: aldo/keto reductase [Calditrichaeota bacterium]|nr:aldo/keto reductase [Calditrichota bacterium]